jgi:hypothetical protein
MPSPPEISQVSLFVTTHWSIVGDAGGDDGSRARDGLAEICKVYWPPLYRLVRRTGKTEQDAEDLV